MEPFALQKEEGGATAPGEVVHRTSFGRAFRMGPKANIGKRRISVVIPQEIRLIDVTRSVVVKTSRRRT